MAHPAARNPRWSLPIVVGIAALFLLGAAPGQGTRGPTAVGTAVLPASVLTAGGSTPERGTAPSGDAVTNESTLVLFNNTVVPGDAVTTFGALPSLEAFDPQTNEVFVADFYSGIVDVVSGTSNNVVTTIRSGEYTNTLAYDPENNNLYFGLQTADLVGVANASTDLIQRTVGIGFEPLSMAADPASGNVFVTGWNGTGSAFLAVINGSYGTVETTFSFGADRFPIAGPNGIAYDPLNGNLYVASIASGIPNPTHGNLTVINGSSFDVVANYSLPFAPGSILFVPSNGSGPSGEFFLGNASGHDVAALDGAGNVLASVPIPNTPSMLAYDPSEQDLFVGIEGNVSVVDTATDHLVTTFPVTRNPAGLAYDPWDGDLYVADYNYNNVSVVNATTYRVVGSALLGAQPYNMAFDTADGDLYVTDLESSQLLVVNGSTNRVVGKVALGTTPYGIAYDPRTKALYVTDYYGDNVSVVNTSTDAVVGYLPAGRNPWAIAYDGANGYLYVTNPSSNNTTVLDPETESVVTWLNFSVAPGAIAYDPVSRALFIGEYDVGRVSVLNASTNAPITNVSTGSEPYTISVDPETGDAFVGNYGSDNVTVLGPRGAALGESVPAGVGVFGSAYDPATGNVYVASFDSDLVTVINASSATGIGGFSTATGPVAVAVDPATGTVYVANYDSGSLTLLSSTFRVADYNVTFRSSGLPAGTSWWVRLDGSGIPTTAANVTFREPNGTGQPFSVGGATGYAAAPGFGAVNVSGADVTVDLVFTPVHHVSPTLYNVTFAEQGVPTGLSWCLSLSSTSFCSSTGTITFSRENGSYPYRYGATVSATAYYSALPGTLVVDGRSVEVNVTFREVRQLVLTEKNLPSGMEWWADLTGGYTFSGAGRQLVLYLPSGTWTFTVQALDHDYVAKGHTVTVSSPLKSPKKAVKFGETFKLETFPLTVTESGLPKGSKWCVVVAGASPHCSKGTTLSFKEPNGTYNYSLTTTRAGYAGPSGEVTVDGPTPLRVAFTDPSALPARQAPTVPSPG